MNTKILSPHCDDAFLSLGGCILGALFFKPIFVCNVFTISRYTLLQQGSAPESETTQCRRKEEREVAKICDFHPSFFNFPEPFARPGFDQISDVINIPLHRNNRLYLEVKKKVLKTINRGAQSLICIPLACGNHIDHRIVFHIILEWFQKHKDRPLLFFEDLPYSGYAVETSPEKQVDHYFSNKLTPIIFKNFDIYQKIEILKIYSSQLSESDLKTVLKYHKLIKGERVWLNSAAQKFIKLKI